MATQATKAPISVEQYEHSKGYPNVFVTGREGRRIPCEHDEYLTSPPVVAVEVISPADRKSRVEQKIGLYLDGGERRVAAALEGYIEIDRMFTLR